ncbi:hypothetical protein [Geomonas anaerohicana]|uniref:Secreted protein n=1 Tax=Geomonas anaerohicana TaxID=2798583 RepID=A0ABS0YGC9_9BACT|nr:hypothetical protein [Geomonas anaerohicana]MBJ6751378.1 hypothetical protein [Geomonas anaerohicana]
MKGIGFIVIFMLLQSSGNALCAVSSGNGSRDCVSSIGYIPPFRPVDRTHTPSIDSPSPTNHRMLFPTIPGRGYEIRSAFPAALFHSIANDGLYRWRTIYRGIIDNAVR